jgi:hypothetical protein
MHPAPAAEQFLQSCESDPRYINDPIVKKMLDIELPERPGYMKNREDLEAIWKKHGIAVPELPAAITTPVTQATLPPTSASAPTPKQPDAKRMPAVAQTDISTYDTFILIMLSVIVLAGIYWRTRRK